MLEFFLDDDCHVFLSTFTVACVGFPPERRDVFWSINSFAEGQGEIQTLSGLNW